MAQIQRTAWQSYQNSIDKRLRRLARNSSNPPTVDELFCIAQQGDEDLKSLSVNKQFLCRAKLIRAACENVSYFNAMKPRHPLVEKAVTKKVARETDVLVYLQSFHHQVEYEMPILRESSYSACLFLTTLTCASHAGE